MQSSSALRKVPDVTAQEKMIVALKTRITKLRWMGFDGEAGQWALLLRHLDADIDFPTGHYDAD